MRSLLSCFFESEQGRYILLDIGVKKGCSDVAIGRMEDIRAFEDSFCLELRKSLFLLIRDSFRLETLYLHVCFEKLFMRCLHTLLFNVRRKLEIVVP